MSLRITRLPVAAAALYDDLLARARGDALAGVGPVEAFTVKTIKGRRYWYSQEPGPARRQRYIGAETPELLARIVAAREEAAERGAERAERAALVRALRAAGIAPPPAPVGRLLAALADAGVFRLRAVLVGTHAFNHYPAMLGVLLPGALGQTSDVDIAQDPAVSVAVGDRIDQPIEDILRSRVDPRFAAAPDLAGPDVVSHWRAPGLDLQLLASNRGAHAARRRLPALRADGIALRMMDFLLRDPVPAVALHDAGVLVTVPDPARYAVHKIMVATRRTDRGSGKARKDLAQAAALVGVLAEDRPQDLRAAHAEAQQRGAAWRSALRDGTALLAEEAQAALAAAAA